MARTAIPLIVLDSTSNPPTLVTGATVTVTNRSDATPATVFTAETGGSVRTQPLTTDAEGRVSGWLDRGAYAFAITIPGRSPFTVNEDSAPGSDGAISTTWIVDSAVTAPKLASNSVTTVKVLDGNISTPKLADTAVTTGKLADDSVTSAKIAPLTIQSGDIGTDQITGPKIPAGEISLAHLAAAIQQALTPPGTMLSSVALTTPTGWLLCDGSAVNRTTFSSLFGAISITRNGTTTNASATVTGLSQTADLGVGWGVSGTGIPAGATVLSINSSSQITLSANATASGTVSLVFAPYGIGNGTTTFNLPNPAGRSLVGKGTHADIDSLADNDGVTLASRTPKHAITVAEIASHGHGVSDPGHAHLEYAYGSAQGGATNGGGFFGGFYNNGSGGVQILGGTGNAGTGISIQGTGSGQAHNHGYLVTNFIIKT